MELFTFAERNFLNKMLIVTAPAGNFILSNNILFDFMYELTNTTPPPPPGGSCFTSEALMNMDHGNNICKQPSVYRASLLI